MEHRTQNNSKIARDIFYIAKDDFNDIYDQASTVERILSAFISASEERVDEYSRTQRPSEDEIQVNTARLCLANVRAQRAPTIPRGFAPRNLYKKDRHFIINIV